MVWLNLESIKVEKNQQNQKLVFWKKDTIDQEKRFKLVKIRNDIRILRPTL